MRAGFPKDADRRDLSRPAAPRPCQPASSSPVQSYSFLIKNCDSKKREKKEKKTVGCGSARTGSLMWTSSGPIIMLLLGGD